MAVVSVVAMTSHRPDFDLNRPAALIAALPAILGFVPEKSLVLVALEEGQLGSVMRADLSEDLAERVGQLAEMAASSDPDAAIVVIVDSDGAHCSVCNKQYRRLFDALAEALAQHDIELCAAHVVDQIVAGGRWHCVDGCGCGGEIDDPAASPMAVAAVVQGRRLYPRRVDLEAVIAVDGARSAALVDALESAAEARAVAYRADPAGCSRADVQMAMAAAAGLVSGQLLPDTEVAWLGCALNDIAVRDTLYALAVGTDADAAESLWSLLARVLPQPWRVEALTLLGFSAYVRGDGPLAGMALDAALRCDPEHRMAGMLDTALQSGLRPNDIRMLARTGYRLADELGVQLPPPQSFGLCAG